MWGCFKIENKKWEENYVKYICSKIRYEWGW